MINKFTYMVSNDMPFGNRLATLRKQRGLTQAALGRLIGVTKTQVYRYENGSSQPTLDVIRKMAITLSVTSDTLVFEKDERKPDASLNLLLEGISNLDPNEKYVVKELIEGILLKHQAKLLI